MQVEIVGKRVSVSGELALGEGDLARLAEDLDALAGSHDTVEVDLGGVTFIDSVGLGILVSATRTARGAGHRLRVVAASERVRSMVALTQLESWLDLAP